MTLNRYRLLFAAVGCGLAFTPVAGLRAQQTGNPPTQAQPANSQSQGGDQEVDPLKRERSDKQKFAAHKAVQE